MLSSGYEGVREIQKRLTNTMGWSATSGMVDNWVYDEANSTFIEDPEMAARLMEANPNSFRKLVATFLEANGRGYWDADEEKLERLRQMYTDGESATDQNLDNHRKVLSEHTCCRYRADIVQILMIWKP